MLYISTSMPSQNQYQPKPIMNQTFIIKIKRET